MRLAPDALVVLRTRDRTDAILLSHRLVHDAIDIPSWTLVGQGKVWAQTSCSMLQYTPFRSLEDLITNVDALSIEGISFVLYHRTKQKLLPLQAISVPLPSSWFRFQHQFRFQHSYLMLSDTQ